MENITKLEQDILNDFTQKLVNQFDNLIIEGLKLHGYSFENKLECQKFIQTNCRGEDDTDLQIRTYFVNEIPFFKHYYSIDLSNLFNENNEYKMTCNYGSYKILPKP